MKQLARFFVGFLVVLGMLGMTTQPAIAKSYDIDAVDIKATILPTGAMSVEETRRYDFDGSFSFAYQTIKKQPDSTSGTGRTAPYTLSNFRLCDETTCYQQTTEAAENEAPSDRVNSFYVRDEADQYYIKWFYESNGGSKAFTLKYTVDNAITLQRDAAELGGASIQYSR